jgi:uncharacterized UPF0160 family protein
MTPRSIGTGGCVRHPWCGDASLVVISRSLSLGSVCVSVPSHLPPLSSFIVLLSLMHTRLPCAHPIRYDHHQRGFEETYDGNHKTKLSSAGLVYKHFGRRLIAAELSLPETDAMVSLCVMKVYDGFVEALDGGDNGIDRYPTEVRPAYASGGTSLADRVGRLNPSWYESDQSDARRDALFERAVSMATEEWLARVHDFRDSFLPARRLVEAALEARDAALPEVLPLERFVPWKGHLADIEAERPDELGDTVKYAVFPSDGGDNWRICAVPLTRGSFALRLPLPEPWRGVRGEALDALIGGEGGAVFCHANGFIGGHKTREGVLRMARLALGKEEEEAGGGVKRDRDADASEEPAAKRNA